MEKCLLFLELLWQLKTPLYLTTKNSPLIVDSLPLRFTEIIDTFLSLTLKNEKNLLKNENFISLWADSRSGNTAGPSSCIQSASQSSNWAAEAPWPAGPSNFSFEVQWHKYSFLERRWSLSWLLVFELELADRLHVLLDDGRENPQLLQLVHLIEPVVTVTQSLL